jgi:hypothetical protein
MIEIEKFLNIENFYLTGGKLVGLKNIAHGSRCLVLLDESIETTIITKAKYACAFWDGLLFYEEKNGSDLLYTDFNSIRIVEKGICYFGIDSNYKSFVVFVKKSRVDESLVYENFVLRDNGTVDKSEIGFGLFLNNKYLLGLSKSTHVYAYSDSKGKKAWQSDLSQIGPYIKMDDTVAGANEIDGDLMGSEEYGLIYVPMAGGQLVALDSENGEVKWVNSTDWNGRYGMYKQHIFKVSDKLYKFDGCTGELLMRRDFREIIDIDFVPSGPVLVYNDLILLLDTRGATVVMVDTASLSYINHVHIEGVPGIAHSKNVLDWQNGKLYILDIGRTLHVFEP